jgi:diguanylate cyclase (GGDEF)-like protein
VVQAVHAVQTWTVPVAVDPHLRRVCRGDGLRMAFQPIFRMSDGFAFGFEALMRPPLPWTSPLELIEAARGAECGIDLDLACCQAAIRTFVRRQLPGRLFLNLGAAAMAASGATKNRLVQMAIECGLPPSRLVVELTEREPIHDLDLVIDTLRALRNCGLGVALDDYGQGYSGMRLWLELRPDIIKIDQFFVSGLQTSSDKFEALRSIVRLAESLDTELIAEGIETKAELAVLRDLGISLGQGYLLGRPEFDPPLAMPDEALATLGSNRISVFPEKLHLQAPNQTVGKLLVPVASASRTDSNNDISQRFAELPQTHALAVVDAGIPVGLINRQQFTDWLSKPFHREVYGTRPCTVNMNARPLVVEASTPIESLMQVLAGEDQRYLADGFIIVADGHYLGLGTGEALVRSVSALRIEAARHANPLTFLPGNIPITEHISRLLASGTRFVAAYADLDAFKPFNDQYGYWRGDEMIKLAARTLLESVDPVYDFVGHVGGDDFVILFQSADWLDRCQRILARFAQAARGLYDEEDVARGGLTAEDRLGNPTFYRLTSMSIGVVEVNAGSFRSPEAVASQAAAAKRRAKKTGNCIERSAETARS